MNSLKLKKAKGGHSWPPILCFDFVMCIAAISVLRAGIADGGEFYIRPPWNCCLAFWLKLVCQATLEQNPMLCAYPLPRSVSFSVLYKRITF